MNIFGFEIAYIPSFGGFAVLFVLILLLAWALRKRTGFTLVFSHLYESMNTFFAEILEDDENSRTTTYVISMFFVILFYNILGLLTDFIAPMFGYNTEAGGFYLAEYLGFATSDYHFNMAMAAVGVLITIGVQFSTMSGDRMLGKTISTKKRTSPFLKTFNLVYEYVPFWGKDIITIQKGTMHPLVYYPLLLIVKIFDIVISLFVGALDIIGLLAKVVSLSFRLFGNMLSGTALLTVLVLGLGGATKNRFGVEFPILGPIILFAQGLLVACIQAFVFALLVAIFLKVARMGGQEEQEVVS